MGQRGRPRTPVETAGWTRENLAWLAGLWDGRGTQSWGVKAWQMAITGERDVIARVREVAGFGAVSIVHDARGEIVRWRTGSHAVPALLAAMWPWMGHSRRQEAARAIRGETWG